MADGNNKAHYFAGYDFDFSTMWSIELGNQPPICSQDRGGFMTYSEASSPTQSYISGAIISNIPQLGLSLVYLL